MSVYVELPSDHEMSAFLAGLTPSRVLRDLEPMSRVEKRRLEFLRQKSHLDALRTAGRLEPWQLDLALNIGPGPNLTDVREGRRTA